MKLKKILAAVAAAAVAVSTMAVTAFADTFEGSHTMSDANWWTQEFVMQVESDVPVSNLIGDLDPATVTSISFKGDTTFIVGYNGTDGKWHQSPNEGITEGTFDDILLVSLTADESPDGEAHDPAFCICLSKGDSVEYTITWTVTTGEKVDTPAETEAAPEETAEEAPEAEEAAEDVDEPEEVDVDEDEPESEPVAIAETEEAAPVADVAPAVDNTPAPATGNTAVATVVAVMAVAGAAAIVAKKRK